MKKILILVVVVAMMTALIAAPVMAAGKNGQSGKSNVGHVYLYEKDATTWDIVEGGAWGKYNYKLSGEGAGTMVSGVFNGKGLVAGCDYSLIYYPEVAPNPWPAGGTAVVVIGSDTANKGGNVHITGTACIGGPDKQPAIGDYPGMTGDKIWLVLSSDITTGPPDMITGWNPSEYLFEGALINTGA